MELCIRRDQRLSPQPIKDLYHKLFQRAKRGSARPYAVKNEEINAKIAARLNDSDIMRVEFADFYCSFKPCSPFL